MTASPIAWNWLLRSADRDQLFAVRAEFFPQGRPVSANGLSSGPNALGNNSAIVKTTMLVSWPLQQMTRMLL